MDLLYVWRIVQAIGGLLLWNALRDNNRLRKNIKTISAGPPPPDIVTVRIPTTSSVTVSLPPSISKNTPNVPQHQLDIISDFVARFNRISVKLFSDEIRPDDDLSITLVRSAVFFICFFKLIQTCYRLGRKLQTNWNTRVSRTGKGQGPMSAKIRKTLDDSAEDSKRYVWSLLSGQPVPLNSTKLASDDSVQSDKPSTTADPTSAELIKSLNMTLEKMEADAKEAQAMVNVLKVFRSKQQKTQEGKHEPSTDQEGASQEELQKLREQIQSVTKKMTAAHDDVAKKEREIDDLKCRNDLLEIENSRNVKQASSLRDAARKQTEVSKALEEQVKENGEKLDQAQLELEDRTRERDDKQAELRLSKEEIEEAKALSAELTQQYDTLSGVLEALNQDSGSATDYGAQLALIEQAFPDLVYEPDS